MSAYFPYLSKFNESTTSPMFYNSTILIYSEKICASHIHPFIARGKPLKFAKNGEALAHRLLCLAGFCSGSCIISSNRQQNTKGFETKNVDFMVEADAKKYGHNCDEAE
jgi:hypothetical protein